MKLKPCPFCGSGYVIKNTTMRYTQVCCQNCGATITRGLSCGKCEDFDEAEEMFGKEAVEAWNRRVTE